MAHGTNLMTDYLHFNRISRLFSNIAGIISDTLGATYRLLGFAMIAENNQEVISPKMTNIIETHKVQIGYLNNKISLLKKNISTKEILDSNTNDQDSQG